MRGRLSTQPANLSAPPAASSRRREVARTAALEELELKTELEVARAAFVSASANIVTSVGQLDSVTCLLTAPISGGRARRRPATKAAPKPRLSRPDSVTLHIAAGDALRSSAASSRRRGMDDLVLGPALSLDNAHLEDDDDAPSRTDLGASMPSPNKTLESHTVLDPRGGVYKTGARAAVHIAASPAANRLDRTANLLAMRPPSPLDYHESTPVRPIALGTARSASFPPPPQPSDRQPQPSWVETPWMVPSGPVSVPPAHAPAPSSVLAVAAAATTALAALLIGVVLFVLRSNDVSRVDPGAQTAALQSPPPAAVFPPPPPVPSDSLPAEAPPASAPRAPAASKVVEPAPVRKFSLKAAAPRRAPRVEAPRPSAPPSAAAKESGGKSIEDILNALGEEQLKR